MRIHHLNCGTLRPFGRRAINGVGLPFQMARMVCHCLLVETDRRLVLVDSGFGLDDIAELRRSLLGSVLGSRGANVERRRHVQTRLLTRPRLDPAETAVRQVAALGFSPSDVSDVVLTHLDSDHAGGLRDFPAARVHVTEIEHRAAMAPATPLERLRYWTQQWSHGPQWVTYAPDGETWLGFDGVRELEDLPGFAYVPLPGHTRGQAGVLLNVARDSGPQWLLHAADAYFFHREADPVSPRATPALARFQARLQVDREARHDSQERLRRLVAEHGDEVQMFCSHDPVEFERFRNEEA